MKRFILYVFTLVAVFTILTPRVSAQESSTDADTISIIQRTQVMQEPIVAQMLDTYIQDCKTKESASVFGYRVQILSLTGTSARDEALKMRNQFMVDYSDFPIYMEYKSPSFRLMVGDCRTKSEALFIKNKIKNTYPNAFVVYDKIQYPQLITEDIPE
ncbi:MAG: SPOR domain-containing protein [Mangrovibacterium sp.]